MTVSSRRKAFDAAGAASWVILENVDWVREGEYVFIDVVADFEG